jgi:TetR/AcrR family transcriptional repressor of nem operon
VTKGSFFHHFKSKEELGVAAARFWAETTTAFFATALYHQPDNPLDRVLAYVAFRKSIITSDVDFTCLVGTMAEEVHATSPAIRDACAASIFGHAATLEADIATAMQEHSVSSDVTAASLARHTQTVIQGAFVLAKAGNDPDLARESLDHLDRYIRLLFGRTDQETLS